MDTVKENRKGYRQAQYDRAVKAQSLYHELGAQTLDNYKGFIKMGGVQNCPIRIEDINIAQNIFGPDMATLKEKIHIKNQNHFLKIGVNCHKKFWRNTGKLSCV